MHRRFFVVHIVKSAFQPYFNAIYRIKRFSTTVTLSIYE